MATKESKTKWTLEFNTERADDLRRKVEQIAKMLEPDTLNAGFAKMEAFMATNQRQMAALDKTLQTLTRSLKNFGGGADDVDRMGKGLERARKETRQLGEEAQRSGRFMQGLVQGLGVGEYMPAGPGMGRQVAGRMIGRGARRVGRSAAGLASAPFTGLSGVAQGLQGIPVIGGLLGGQVMAAQATSQQFVQYQRQQLQLAPYMDPMQMAAQAQAARSGAVSPAAATRMRGEALYRAARPGGADLQSAVDAGITNVASSLTQGLPEKIREPLEEGLRNAVGKTTVGKAIAAVSDPKAQENAFNEMLRRPEGAAAVSAAERRITEKRQEAYFAEARKQIAIQKGNLASQGLGLAGMNVTQSMQFAGQVMGVGGGTMAGAQGQGAISSAMAAQTLLGAGPQVSGAFLRAGRRGGIVGAQGQAGPAMVEAIRAGMEAGMDNTEVRDFLQQIASAQEEFKRTGIPVAPKAIAGMGRAFAASGVGIGRGGAMGTALTRRAQEIAQQGPRSAAEFQVLKQLGGFEGGGLRELEQAELRLEKGEFGTQEMMGLVRTFARGVSGAGAPGQRRGIRRGLGALGVNIGVEESMFLQAAAEGGMESLTAEQRERVTNIQREISDRGALAPQNLEDFKQQARTMTTVLASTVKRQASIENQRIAIGGKIVTAMQNFELATTKGQKAFATFGDNLNALALALNQFANLLPTAADKLKDLVDGPPDPTETVE